MDEGLEGEKEMKTIKDFKLPVEQIMLKLEEQYKGKSSFYGKAFKQGFLLGREESLEDTRKSGIEDIKELREEYNEVFGEWEFNKNRNPKGEKLILPQYRMMRITGKIEYIKKKFNIKESEIK